MIGAGPRRGQPLIVLGALLLGWVGLRAALWEDIAFPVLPAPVEDAVARVLPPFAQRGTEPVARPTRQAPVFAEDKALIARPIATVAPPPLPLTTRPLAAPAAPLPEFAPAGGSANTARVAAAHQLA